MHQTVKGTSNNTMHDRMQRVAGVWQVISPEPPAAAAAEAAELAALAAEAAAELALLQSFCCT